MANVVRIVVDAVNHTGRVFRAVSREAGRMVNNMAQAFSRGTRKFFDAFDNGIGGALKSVLSTPYLGPIVIGGLVAAIEMAAPFVAAALAGALTFGLGAAFVGIGALIVSKNKDVKKKLTDDFKDIKKTMSDAFKPLIPVVEHFGDVAKRVSKAFAPFIEKASKEISPHLTKFMDNLGDALIKLTPALDPLMDSFGTILDELGPKLPDMFSDITDSLTGLFDTVAENPDAFIQLIQGTVKAFDLLLDIISKLTAFYTKNVDSWKSMWDAAKDAWESAKDALSDIGDFFSGMWRKISSGAGKVKGAVGGVAGAIGKLKGKTVHIAQAGAGKVKDAVLGVIGTIRRFVGKVVHIGESGASRARGAVQSVINTIRRFVGKVVRVGANVFGAGAIRNLMGWIRRLTGKTVNVVANVIGAGKSLLGFAHGGVVGAAGGGPRSGLVMVGEQGRELVKLAPGSQVIPHGQTEAMMAGGGGGVAKLVWGGGPTDDLGKALWEYFKEKVRIEGGGGSDNVQKALG